MKNLNYKPNFKDIKLLGQKFVATFSLSKKDITAKHSLKPMKNVIASVFIVKSYYKIEDSKNLIARLKLLHCSNLVIVEVSPFVREYQVIDLDKNGQIKFNENLPYSPENPFYKLVRYPIITFFNRTDEIFLKYLDNQTSNQEDKVNAVFIFDGLP
jgi:hypothetical protein